MQDYDKRFRLNISIDEAFRFAMGESNLDYAEVTELMRHVVGVLLLDSLQYAEHWRMAAEVRALLAGRWPGCPSFEEARKLR